MSKNKSALGKGLSALISEGSELLTEERPQQRSSSEFNNDSEFSIGIMARLLPVDMLVPGRFQPRGYFDETKLNELAESIKENGVIQPILVRTEDTEGRYQIIAGERRWRASKQAGLKEIPAVIKELTDKEALEAALIENIQRQSLTPIEEAEGYKKLQEEFDYTQERLASNLGKSRSHITNMMRLLQLPEEVKDLINTGALTMGHARALVNCENPVDLAYKIIEGGLSVRETEKYAAGSGQLGGGNKTPAKPKEAKQQQAPYAPAPKPQAQKDEDLVILENSISSSLGLKVSIDETDTGGRISIFFNNLSELDEILQKLG